LKIQGRKNHRGSNKDWGEAGEISDALVRSWENMDIAKDKIGNPQYSHPRKYSRSGEYAGKSDSASSSKERMKSSSVESKERRHGDFYESKLKVLKVSNNSRSSKNETGDTILDAFEGNDALNSDSGDLRNHRDGLRKSSSKKLKAHNADLKSPEEIAVSNKTLVEQDVPLSLHILHFYMQKYGCNDPAAFRHFMASYKSFESTDRFIALDVHDWMLDGIADLAWQEEQDEIKRCCPEPSLLR
jgi:hypothetical protein